MTIRSGLIGAYAIHRELREEYEGRRFFGNEDLEPGSRIQEIGYLPKFIEETKAFIEEQRERLEKISED